MTILTQTVFDVPFSGDIGNMNGKTPRIVFDLSGFAAPNNITRFRITMQGSVDEPYIVNKLYGGQDGNLVPVKVGGATSFTVPQGGQLVSDWIAFSALPNIFSMFINGGTSNDRLTGILGGTAHTMWLKNGGDFANQSGLSGFTDYAGYHALVTKLEIEYDDAPPAPVTYPFRRYLMGCEPERVSHTVLRIMQGSWVTGSANPTEIFAHSQFEVDLTSTGLNGVDAGSMVTNQDYFAYLVRNPSTGDIGAVVSASITYGGVTLPSGYTQIRKLPWGFVWKGATRGLEEFHTSGWPLPFIRYTGAVQNADWSVLTNGSAAARTAIDCTDFMPDNSRMLYACIKVTGSGSAFISSSTYDPLFEVKDGVFVHVRTTAARLLYYSVTGSAQLSIYAFGYTQTERS